MLLANAVAVLHAAAILFMLTGSLFALRWPRVLWVHVPVSIRRILLLAGPGQPPKLRNSSRHLWRPARL